MKNVLVRYGLTGGLIVTILMGVSFPLFTFPEDYGIAEITGYATILLSLSAVFMAIRTYRDKHNNGKITFGKAFLIGLYITLIAGSIYALSYTIYSEVTGDKFYDVYRNMKVEEVNNLKISNDEKVIKINEIDKQIEIFKHPVVKFLFTLLAEYAPSGIIISLIAAAVLKRKNKEPRIVTVRETGS